MKEYAHYAIINGKDADFNLAQKTLASRVELQMIKGWIPQGGVLFIGLVKERDGELFVFSQALFMPAPIEMVHP